MPSLGRRDAKSIASACALNKSKFVVIMFEIKNPKHQHVWTKKGRTRSNDHSFGNKSLNVIHLTIVPRFSHNRKNPTIIYILSFHFIFQFGCIQFLTRALYCFNICSVFLLFYILSMLTSVTLKSCSTICI
jgi:hypothetical protein